MKVKCNVQVLSKKTIDEMPNAWTRKDYFYILEELGFEEELDDSGIKEMVLMALSDQEPEESAELLLNYKLKEHLTKGQIQQLSHEMQEDKASEEYPDIFIQQELFNINQLLYESFEGRFPTCKALELVITLEVNPTAYMEAEDWWNEIIVKALSPALGEHSAIVRLYKEDMNGKKRFRDADGIIWERAVNNSMNGSFEIRLYSSEYWLHDLHPSEAYDTTIEVLEL